MRTIRLRRVVVTGIGVVSPNAIGKVAYGEANRHGRSGIKSILEFDTAHLKSKVAGLVRGLDLSEVMEKRHLRAVSRTAPLAIIAAREALCEAGLDPANLDLPTRRDIGVILGTGGGGIAHVEELYEDYFSGKMARASALAVPAGTPGNIASELSISLGLRGPSHVISTGCTSSSDAVGYAFRRIRYGESPLVLAGGSDAPIAPGIMKGFDLMGITSHKWNAEPERASRPFAKDRDGFVLSEGSWMFVLEDYEHAQNRGAPILGEVLGYASTCDAWHRVSMSPDLEEPVRAIQLALSDAGLRPEDMGYVNLHGTATPLNDRVEITVMQRVFGDKVAKVPMSSTKSLIGHPQGACGAAGMAATWLGLAQGFLPPTLNLDETDPGCELDPPGKSDPGRNRALQLHGIWFQKFRARHLQGRLSEPGRSGG